MPKTIVPGTRPFNHRPRSPQLLCSNFSTFRQELHGTRVLKRAGAVEFCSTGLGAPRFIASPHDDHKEQAGKESGPSQDRNAADQR